VSLFTGGLSRTLSSAGGGGAGVSGLRPLYRQSFCNSHSAVMNSPVIDPWDPDQTMISNSEVLIGWVDFREHGVSELSHCMHGNRPLSHAFAQALFITIGTQPTMIFELSLV